jgi:dipeptidase E
MGYDLESVHLVKDAPQAVEDAEAVFIGGGNTFRLLKSLYDFELLLPIRRRVAEGIPFIGSSAGAIVAGPSLKTTKDMPIVQPPSFEALDLVSFQISPHYLDPDPHSTHMGETQEERINQFLEENDAPVAGIREGAILRIEGNSIVLKGGSGARIFRKGHEPVETESGAQLDHLLSPST